MMPSILADAEREWDESIAYYESQRKGLGIELFSIYDLIVAIGRNPRRCGWHDAKYRRCASRRFRFVVIYDPEPTPPLILAIHHAARRPDYWRYRIK